MCWCQRLRHTRPHGPLARARCALPPVKSRTVDFDWEWEVAWRFAAAAGRQRGETRPCETPRCRRGQHVCSGVARREVGRTCYNELCVPVALSPNPTSTAPRAPPYCPHVASEGCGDSGTAERPACTLSRRQRGARAHVGSPWAARFPPSSPPLPSALSAHYHLLPPRSPKKKKKKKAAESSDDEGAEDDPKNWVRARVLSQPPSYLALFIHAPLHACILS